jgi:DNA-binding CsgD family transcriptional regulator/tetratricopeptide (TPR) repeat protein
MIRAGGPGSQRARSSGALIGRDEEVAVAVRRWREASAGAGQLLLISGEAGIGKTRLVREVAATIGGEARALSTEAFPQDAEAAGALLLDLSDALRRRGITEPAERIRERLLLDPPIGDAARRRRLLVGDVTETILAVLAETPTLLFLEDLHWADELSLDVIERLAVAVRSTSSLIVVTYRSDELFPRTALRRWRVRLLQQRLAEEVRLPRLAETGTTAMMREITGEVPASVDVALLLERSDGIPLHIEELLAAGGGSGVPDSVADAVVDRVAGLSDLAGAIVAAAAVIGRSFDIGLLAAVSEQSLEAVEGALLELYDHYLVVSRGDTATFDFRHALIRDAIYAAVPRSRRRELHSAVARAAAAAGSRDSFVSDHYERGGEAALARDFALAAARDAARVSAHREAAELFRRVERTTTHFVDDRSRADLHVDLAVELAAIDDIAGAERHFAAALELYRTIGDEIAAANVVSRLMAARHLLGFTLESRTALALDAIERLDGIPGGGPPIVRACVLGGLAAAYMLDRRLDDAIEIGGRSAALAVGPDAVEERMNVDFTLGSVLVFAGRTAEGWSLLESAIAEGLTSGLEEETARGYRMIGSSASVLVDYPRARRWIVEGLEYTSRTERWNDHHYLTAHLAHVKWAEGDLDGAESDAQRALADGGGAVTTRIAALYVLAYVALDRDVRELARERLDEAMVLAEHMNELQRISPVLWGMAELALRDGQADRAIELTERGYAQSARVQDAAYLFPFVVTGVRARLERGDVAAARDWLARTSHILEFRAIPGTMPALDHADGLICLAEGHTGQARVALERASAGWSGLGRFDEGTHVLLDLARCASRSRRPVDAAADLARARALSDANGIVLPAVLLAAASSAERVGEVYDPLSSREYEVARLIAEGLTNREIALRLTISPKTVSAHVEHVLTKLDVARRAEIAAWVSRIG